MSPEERARQTILAGITVTQRDTNGNVIGYESPLQAPICQYQASDATFLLTKSSTFQDYYNTLDRSCAQNSAIVNSAMIFEFTPTKDTPDLIYYQCVTHRNLGWKINVLDAVPSPVSSPRADPVSVPVPVPTPRAVPVSVPFAVPASSPRAVPVSVPTTAPVSSPRVDPVLGPITAPVSSPRTDPVSVPNTSSTPPGRPQFQQPQPQPQPQSQSQPMPLPGRDVSNQGIGGGRPSGLPQNPQTTQNAQAPVNQPSAPVYSRPGYAAPAVAPAQNTEAPTSFRRGNYPEKQQGIISAPQRPQAEQVPKSKKESKSETSENNNEPKAEPKRNDNRQPVRGSTEKQQ